MPERVREAPAPRPSVSAAIAGRLDERSAFHSTTRPPDRQSIASAADLAARIGSGRFDAVRAIYDIRRVPASRLCMNAAGWTTTSQIMGVPRDAVENQILCFIRDRYTGQEAIVNSLRALRTNRAEQNRTQVASEARRAACRWCAEWDVQESGMWSDEWDQARSDDGRIGTRPNWARQSPISGLAFGDHRMHDLDGLTESEFVGLFTTGERYLATARRLRGRARFCAIFINGGPRSGSSVEHAHAQIVARDDRHFAYPEMVATRCPPDYWQRTRLAHDQAGLTILQGDSEGWVSLAPVKERDITALSPDVAEGARVMYRIWRGLVARGTRNFSLTAILSPGYFSATDCPERFLRWPRVVWRFVDRGDPDVKHADIGSMELFGSSVVASDPYATARLLRDERRSFGSAERSVSANPGRRRA